MPLSSSLSSGSSALYTRAQLIRCAELPFACVDGDRGHVSRSLEKWLQTELSGQTCSEGHVRANSIVLRNWSAGECRGENIQYHVVAEVDVFLPSKDLVLDCKCFEVSRAGIAAVSISQQPSPFVFFLPRDQFADHPVFRQISVGSNFKGSVCTFKLKQRSPFIQIIGQPLTSI